MHLTRFEIRNFKSIRSASVDWDDLLVLIGENNCGKSSVLAAIACFLSGASVKDAALFREHQTGLGNAIELVGHFSNLSDEEKQQAAVRGRMSNGRWILKKRYWFEAPAAEHEEAAQGTGEWKEQLFSFSSRELFTGWPSPDATWAAFPAEYAPLIAQLPDRPARPSVASREALRELVRAQRPDLTTISEPEWIPNPGGGGNWKSNANSIMPRAIFVRAVHDAVGETASKDASTYGKLVNLILERRLGERAELQELRTALGRVFELFRPDPTHPERQAAEVRELQARITEGLRAVVAGQAVITTEPPDIATLVMPSTSLAIKDPVSGIETAVEHQGHGLQRTLIITLLQVLADIQDEPQTGGPARIVRGQILLVEEPELYLHPHMERLMRDVIYRLAGQPGIQVACCTHSPVFLDVADRYRSIVRLTRQPAGDSSLSQVTKDIFPTAPDRADRERLLTVARFNPTVNELFFASNVVLFEEFSAIAAIERAASLLGLFDRHQRLRREVSFVDCNGKGNIPAFQRVLNAFSIPYRVLHDLDTNNPSGFAWNERIAALLPQTPGYISHTIGPNDLESLLGYVVPKGMGKPFAAVKKVDDLHANGQMPPEFSAATMMAYFGQVTEPAVARHG